MQTDAINKAISKDGLHQIIPHDVNWKIGDSEVFLNGHFTADKLNQIANYMIRQNMAQI